MKSIIVQALALLVMLCVLNERSIGQWQPTGGMHYSGIMSFAESGDTLYCSCQYGPAVYRSVDHGKSWKVIVDGIPKYVFITVLTVENGVLLAGGTHGIYRSTDGGNHWITVDSSNGWGNKFIATKKNVFYSNGYIMSSSDDGLSWKECVIFPNVFTQTISILDSTLFAATNRGVFISSDWGEHWDTIKKSPKWIQTLYTEKKFWLATSENGRLLRSVNDGLSWDTITKEFSSYIRDFYSFTRIGDTIFGGSSFGILKSVDQGSTWQFLDSGLVEKHTSALLIHNDLILTGSYSDWISRSTDKGKTWQHLVGGGETNWIFATCLASKENSLFAGTSYGVYRSDDDGKTWVPKNDRRLSLVVGSLESRPGFMFCMDYYSEGAAYYSADLGDSWTPMNQFSGDAFTVIDGVFFITHQSSSILRSSDFGQTWAVISLNDLSLSNVRFYKVSNSVFACGYSSSIKLAHSEDKGLHWKSLHSFDSIPTRITSLASIGTMIFAGTIDSGIYRSSDFGISWFQVNNGLGNLKIQTLLVDSNTLFAGTRKGVFFSWDNGKKWHAMNEGLLDSSINALLTYKGYLYMAGDNVSQSGIPSYSGIYRYPLGKLSVHGVNIQPLTPNVTASPNPFTTETSLTINCPESMSMQFEIYDILGKKIYDGGEKVYSKGENIIALNTSAFPDGFLFGRFTSSIGNTQSIKLFKLQSQR